MQTFLEKLAKKVVFRRVDDLQQVVIEGVSILFQKSNDIVKHRSSEMNNTETLKIEQLPGCLHGFYEIIPGLFKSAFGLTVSAEERARMKFGVVE